MKLLLILSVLALKKQKCSFVGMAEIKPTTITLSVNLIMIVESDEATQSRVQRVQQRAQSTALGASGAEGDYGIDTFARTYCLWSI